MTVKKNKKCCYSLFEFAHIAKEMSVTLNKKEGSHAVFKTFFTVMREEKKTVDNKFVLINNKKTLL